MRRRTALLAALAPPVETLDFEVWDVFTGRPLTGNPLGIVWLKTPLADERLLAIAREFRHSESCFVEPGGRVRIFTVEEELPFAGHPVLGTAFALHRRKAAKTITLDIKRGPIAVHFDGSPLVGEMEQGDGEFGPIHDAAVIAKMAGLPASALAADLPVQSVSTGLWKILVPVKTLSAIHAAKLDHAAIAEYCGRSRGERGLYLVTRETEAPGMLAHARNIAARVEDPATGSAAGCAIAWLVKHGAAAAGRRHWLEQGLEIQRPSRLAVRAAREGRDVRVGGEAVLVQEGKLRLG